MTYQAGLALRARMSHLFQGEGLAARAMRSSAFTVFGYGAQQVIRLAANLLLTRLLFPEAFGLMALVYVFIQGLNNFSDVGVTPSIMQSKRGDDPKFLNTAWTMQVGRGALLWLCTLALAVPAAQFYDAPQLAALLPVVGLTLVISGFNPTRLDTASRHLNLGRVTAIELAAQVFGVVVAVVLAWLTGSIWSLVVSGLAAALMQLFLLTRFLPGEGNRFHWDQSAVKELVQFGKWIFLSTIAGFFLSQGDKIVLGKYISLDMLGIYNIGFFLASVPLLLGGTVVRRVLIPIYRDLPPKDSPENFAKLRKMRFAVSAALLSILVVLGMLGSWLIGVLYDPRYALAAGVLVMIALAQAPQIVVLTYDQAALAAGDSRRFFVLAAARASLMIAALIIGAEFYGLFGALIGQTLAMLLVYPVVVWLSRHQGIWDPLHDMIFTAASGALLALALVLNWPAIETLIALNSP